MKRQIARALMFVAVIVAATYVLNLVFDFGKIIPSIYEPKDFEREQQLKRQTDSTKP